MIIAISVVIIGFAIPFTLWLAKVNRLDNQYQINNLKLADALLNDDTHYLAGVDFFYFRSQKIAGLKHLMEPAIQYLYEPNNQKLKKAMLESLYEDPSANVQTILSELEKNPVKFYLNNYRMQALPHAIKDYLQMHYQHFFGSIYLYSPTFLGGKKIIFIPFASYYQIESPEDNKIFLNDDAYKNGEIIWLPKGKMVSAASASYRLKLLPNVPKQFMREEFHEDQWGRMVY